jgi:uncharacterized membrane protein YfcA
MITASCILRIIFYSKVGLLNDFSWLYAVLLATPVYGAIWLGHAVQRRISAGHLRKGIFVFIGLSGIYYLFLKA